VSPNGIGRESFWQASRNGVSGVRRITRFDPTPFQVQVAGQIPTSSTKTRYVEVKDRPHVSRAVPLAIASVGEALEDAHLETQHMTRDELRGIGVMVGSGGGSQDFSEEQYRLYYTGHQKQCSVYTIPTGTIGTLASEVSMRFGFRGLSHIVSTGCTSSTDAMGYAFRHIRGGVLNTIIAGGVDSPIAPLIPARVSVDAHHVDPLEPAAGARFTAFFRATATGSSSPKERGSSSSRKWSRRAPAAPRSTAKSPATGPPARLSIACGWKSAAKSRRAPSGWLSKNPASPPPTCSTSIITAPPPS